MSQSPHGESVGGTKPARTPSPLWLGSGWVSCLSSHCLCSMGLCWGCKHTYAHTWGHTRMHALIYTHRYTYAHEHTPTATTTQTHNHKLMPSHGPRLHLQPLYMWEPASQNVLWFWRPRWRSGTISAGLHLCTEVCHWIQSSGLG